MTTNKKHYFRFDLGWGATRCGLEYWATLRLYTVDKWKKVTCKNCLKIRHIR